MEGDKTYRKKKQNGLQSGIRIPSVSRDESDANPMPSYIFIDGFE